MHLKVNGETRQVPDSVASIAQLLGHLKIVAVGVAIEVNSKLVPRAAHAQTMLSESDEIEIVTFVGGG